MKIELQPSSFDEFIGQNNVKNTIKTMIASSLRQGINLDHMLFHGIPGTGKTSLAGIIANELNRQIHYVQASNLEKKSDLITILTCLNEGDILFIDEIHSLNSIIEESLYNAMEYFVFDLIIGVDASARTMRMNLKKFTLIGATTKFNMISKPFKERFGYIARFNNYTKKELCKIIRNSADKLQIEINDEEIFQISSFSNFTPRIANNLLKRCNDFRISLNKEVIDQETVRKTFYNLDLYKLGLGKEHVDYLKMLRENFNDKWVSLDTIANLMSIPKENILMNIEPLLLMHCLLIKSSRGRKISSYGIDYLLDL